MKIHTMNMTNEVKANMIKSIVPVDCPHCKEVLFVSSAFISPSISVFSEVEIALAKESVKKRIEDSDLSVEEKTEIIKNLMDEATVFGPDDVDSVVQSNLNKE